MWWLVSTKTAVKESYPESPVIICRAHVSTGHTFRGSTKPVHRNLTVEHRLLPAICIALKRPTKRKNAENANDMYRFRSHFDSERPMKSIPGKTPVFCRQMFLPYKPPPNSKKGSQEAWAIGRYFCDWWVFLSQKRCQQSIDFACKFHVLYGNFEFGKPF